MNITWKHWYKLCCNRATDIASTMKLAFFGTVLLFCMTSTSGASCGTICANFVHEQDDLAVCSSRDSAQIWNTTSGECEVHIDANLRIVSYMSMIFTVGVTPAVRYQIGKECWDYVPENVAVAVIESKDDFEIDAVCDSHPRSSPSLGWEMRYVMESIGYSDCASLVVLQEDYLASCVRLHADARALATFGYMLAILVGMLCVCVLPCLVFDGGL